MKNGVSLVEAVLTGLVCGAFFAVCGRQEIRRRVLGGVDTDHEIQLHGAFAVVLVSVAGLTAADGVPFHTAVAAFLGLLTMFGVGFQTGRSVDEADEY